MRVLATYNIKGGVGKTSTAVNLAYLSSRDGARTLLWDLDPQGAASFIFRIKPRVKGGGKGLVRRKFSLGDAIKGTDFDDLDLLPADFSYRNLDLLLDARSKPVAVLRKLLRPLSEDYDTVILDCPPGISLVSESVMYATDTLLIPLIPATLSLRTFDQLTDFVTRIEDRPPSLAAFFSMVDRRKKLHRDVVAAFTARRGDVLQTTIPAASVIEQMAERRAPVPVFAPRSTAAAAYVSLWAELR
ncbi:MAG: ParA family protein [Geodermatophilaceae bacterium]|nr:ParA family protein [Geodermatophilaceae bacterium]